MQYGCIGEKLSHSFSPQIHCALGNPYYALTELPKEAVEEFFQKREFSAINVTIPYKKDALAACDIVSPRAVAIGSVNTVVKEADGRIAGYNTDAYGFEYMLRHLPERRKMSGTGQRRIVGHGAVCAETAGRT